MLEDPSAVETAASSTREARMASPVFDPTRLTGVYTTTPLMALSPAVTAQAHHLVAPGTPVAGYASPVLPPADWPQHFLQIANLQGAGFLSPAGHHPISAQGWPPASPLTLPIPNTPPPPLTKLTDKGDEQTTADSGGGLHGLVSGATHVGDTPTQLPVPDSFSPAAWLKAVPYCFPLPPAVQELPTRSTNSAVDAVLHSKSLTEQLLREFTLEEAVTVLRTALSLLGRSEAADEEQTTIDLTADSTNGSLPSVKLVHPDEFKNPSTFLKIYGDPLCFAKNGPLPKKGRNGNWECSKCGNVNFPRRFRCNMCSTTRHEEGDRVVSEYARQVYERYLYIYKSQQQVANTKQNEDNNTNNSNNNPNNNNNTNNNNNGLLSSITQPQPSKAESANGNHPSHRAFQFNARTQQPRQYTRRNHNNNHHPNSSRQPSNNSGYLSSQHHRDQFAFY